MNNRFIEAIARRIAETTPEFKWLKDFFSKTIQRNANVITRGSNTSQGNLAEWGANGDLTDSGHSTNQDLETTSDVKFRSVEAARIDVNRNLTFKRENTVGTTSSAKSGIMLTGLQSPMIDVPAGDDFGFIDSQYFKDGAIIFLKFNGNSTITHKENGAEADNVRLNHNETHTFTNNDFLTLQYDDVVKEWREIGRAAKNPIKTNTVSSNYQTESEDLIKVDSSGTAITISDFDISKSKLIKIKDTSGSAGSSAITINTQSGQNIDGGSSISINTNYGSAIVQSDGSNVFSF